MPNHVVFGTALPRCSRIIAVHESEENLKMCFCWHKVAESVHRERERECSETGKWLWIGNKMLFLLLCWITHVFQGSLFDLERTVAVKNCLGGEEKKGDGVVLPAETQPCLDPRRHCSLRYVQSRTMCTENLGLYRMSVDCQLSRQWRAGWLSAQVPHIL